MTRRKLLIVLALIGAVAAGAYAMHARSTAEKPVPIAAPKSVLTINVASPQLQNWAEEIQANGAIEAWQIATISAQLSGVRLEDVLVDVGQKVKKGEILARFDDATIKAATAQQDAAVERTRATLAQGEAEAKRADMLKGTGSMSAQELATYVTTAETARADLKVELAKQTTQKINLGYATVVAPDDGIISSRTATIGAVGQNGAELFQMIRQNRLEWRAQLPEKMLGRIARPDVTAIIETAGGQTITGTIRVVSPIVDAATRNAIVYVDLPGDAPAKPGMYAQGKFILPSSPALTVPTAALVVRDGYTYVFRVTPDRHVAQVKIETLRRQGDDTEIKGDITEQDSIALDGAGFLADGDLVTVADIGTTP